MTRIALIRHFPTDWNGEGRLQGRTDRPLTPAARVTLAALALPPPWDRAAVITSPLTRAADTAAALAGGRPVALDARLVERSWGDWEGERIEDLRARHGGRHPIDMLGEDGRPPGGGESADDALARVRPALAVLAAAGQPAVVVMHKALMRAILAEAWPGPTPAPEVKRARLYPMIITREGVATHGEPPQHLLSRDLTAQAGPRR